MQIWTTLWINVKLVQKIISSIKVLHKFFLCRCWCLLMWCNKHPTKSYACAKSWAYERFCMKRTFVTIRPVVIVVNCFSLLAIVSATLVVKKDENGVAGSWANTFQARRGKTFYGYLRTEILNFERPYCFKRGCQYPSNKFEIIWQVAHNSFSLQFSHFVAHYVLIILV